MTKIYVLRLTRNTLWFREYVFKLENKACCTKSTIQIFSFDNSKWKTKSSSGTSITRQGSCSATILFAAATTTDSITSLSTFAEEKCNEGVDCCSSGHTVENNKCCRTQKSDAVSPSSFSQLYHPRPLELLCHFFARLAENMLRQD